MQNNVLVSITILSFNRKTILRKTLQNIYSQNYKNFEILIADNRPTDNTIEMISSEFPDVNIILMGKNIGASVLNYAFEKAKGEYIFILDDDSYPEKDTINKCIKNFDNENIGLIACKIVNIDLNVEETKSFEKYPNTFIGCGAMIRKGVLKEVGGYDPDILNHDLHGFCKNCYSDCN